MCPDECHHTIRLGRRYGTRQAEAHWPIGTRPAGKQRTVPGGNVSGGRNLYSTGSLFPTTCTEVPGESGGATARVVGRSNGTDHLLPDSAEAASILGAEYAGWLIHAGLQIYYKFLKAAHQSCAAHLIRRCRDLAEVATPTVARFPLAKLALKTFWSKGLAYGIAIWSRRSLPDCGRPPAGWKPNWTACSPATIGTRPIGDWPSICATNAPTCSRILYCPGLVDATNNLAERVMRILVMIRKNWGGNRTENGARTQAILTSVLCTARQQDQDIFHLLVDLLRSQQPKPLDMLPPEIDDTNDIEGQRVQPHKCGQPMAADWSCRATPNRVPSRHSCSII